MSKAAAEKKANRYGGKVKREIYLEPAQNDRLEAQCKASGKSWPEYVRQRLFGREPEDAPALAALYGLQKLVAEVRANGVSCDYLTDKIEDLAKQLREAARSELEQ